MNWYAVGYFVIGFIVATVGAYANAVADRQKTRVYGKDSEYAAMMAFWAGALWLPLLAFFLGAGAVYLVVNAPVELGRWISRRFG